MVETGSVIRATVVRAEPYGLFLHFGGQPVFVHLPEVSWVETGDLGARFPAGRSIEVLVLGYNYPKRELIGSLRRLHPEENPYRELARLEPGTVLQAKVMNTWGNEVTCRLSNGARGHIPARKMAGPVRVGDTLNTVITALAVDDGRLWLEPAVDAIDPASNQPIRPSGRPGASRHSLRDDQP
jgi:ribosomal protein S1